MCYFWSLASGGLAGQGTVYSFLISGLPLVGAGGAGRGGAGGARARPGVAWRARPAPAQVLNVISLTSSQG